MCFLEKRRLLSLMLVFTYIFMSLIYVKAEKEDNEYYLSDLDWLTATHGDWDQSKQVQKDHPFTLGNNGEETKISLKMADGEIRTFAKGIGTVAANPSVITYDITNAKVKSFSCYIGIDVSANHGLANHAKVEKVEIVVDDIVLFTTLPSYPNGINYATAAIDVHLQIPQSAKKFELKSYAGSQTWGDEVVFANAKFIAEGNFAKKNNLVNTKRREISNKSPLMMIPLYANGEEYASMRKYSFWGDDTLIGKWEAVPDDLKPYTAIELHPDDLPKQDGIIQDFYEHFLQEAQGYIDPISKENKPIPLILTVYTAGNQPYYTAAHWLTTEWIDAMYKKYSCLQGVFCTENYWVWTNDIEKKAAEYLTISAKNGGYFIWAEQNNGAAIEKAMGTEGRTEFLSAVQKHADNFIFMSKNTPENEGNDAPTISYMTGLWLAGYVNQWGGLMDTWKWYETGKWLPFAKGNIGKKQANRQWLSEPEALLGIEAMMIYLHGGCVYNFEHPAYTYGVENKQSPLYKNVIQEFFRYVVEHPAPAKAEILSSLKAIIHGDLSKMGNGNFFVGLNTELAQSPTYTTGRYGSIPFIPSSIAKERLASQFAKYGIQVLEQNDDRISNLPKRKMLFDRLYKAQYSGDIFATLCNNTWYIANYKYNEQLRQQAKDLELNLDSGCIKMQAELEPHSYMILTEQADSLFVTINNYVSDKTELWENVKTAEEAAQLPELTKKEALNWVSKHINNPRDNKLKASKLVISGLGHYPQIKDLKGLALHYTEPVIHYDATSDVAEITIMSNGYLHFAVA